MSAEHRYWITECAPTPVGEAILAAVAGRYWVTPHQGACGTRALVKVTDGLQAPAGVLDLDLAAWTAYQSGPAWVRHEPQEWTGTEKAVLVPIAEGTADHVAHLAAGWAACEYHDGSRLVRYTGTKPAALASYATLYAADVAALLGGG